MEFGFIIIEITISADSTKNKILISNYMKSIFLILAYLVVILISNNYKKNGRKYSLFLWVFWTAMVFVSSIVLRSNIIKYNKNVYSFIFY
jgi:uncharacterized membrane protein SirB2